MNLNEICKDLDDLWPVTKFDWNLSFSYCLTEPTCPMMSIAPEGTNITRYTAHCDPHQVEETIKNIVLRVKEEIIEGKFIGRAGHPMTNSDDGILEKWLTDRQTNKDLVFPYLELRKIVNKRYKDKYLD